MDSKVKKVSVLFVCIENACRSQIAEGFAKELGKDFLIPYSAGSNPATHVNPLAVEVMKERGFDITQQRPGGFYDIDQNNFDYVITMGCKDTCPLVPSKKTLDWNISDPKGKPITSFRKIRDEIEKNIKDFVSHIQQKK